MDDMLTVSARFVKESQRKYRGRCSRVCYHLRQRVSKSLIAARIRGLSIAPKPNSSRALPGQQVFPYLLKGLAIRRPNLVWGIDITYIRLLGSWLYLVAIIDWYSRYVVSWELDDSLEVDFVLKAVEPAFGEGKPERLNSDQGSQFTSAAYITLVE